jgi:site-specific DNA-methyltransferase (adenine-specific)
VRPYYAKDSIVIYHADCREVLPSLCFDLVVTDPPYGTGGWRRTCAGAGGDPSGSLVTEPWDDGALDWLSLLPACVPVMTFWPAARTSCLLNAANLLGLTKHRTLYMRKRDPKPMPAGRTKWSVEPVWVLSRDGFVLSGGDDVFEATTPRKGRDGEATGHPYQKPVEVVRWLIAKTAAVTVCDPFMGSGTTLRAAKDLGRSAVGVEADERWCEVAARRLSQGVLPFDAAPHAELGRVTP